MLFRSDGTFGSPLPLINAGSPVVEDFNHDNLPDILEVGANQVVFLFNESGPGFAVSAGTGASATVAAGKTATYSLSLGGNGGFSGPVSLACSGAPVGSTCAIVPTIVNLSGTSPATATVSITTTAASQLLPSAFPDPVDPARRIIWIFGVWIIAGIGTAFAAMGQRSRRRFSYACAAACCVLLLVSVSLIAGCGGGSNPPSGSGTGGATGGTATGTYTITVTATSQSPTVTRKTKLTLIVQ